MELNLKLIYNSLNISYELLISRGYQQVKKLTTTFKEFKKLWKDVDNQNFNTQFNSEYIFKCKTLNNKNVELQYILDSSFNQNDIQEKIKEQDNHYIFVFYNRLNDSIKTTIQKGLTKVEFFMIKDLQINILNNKLQPKITILTEAEKFQFYKRYCINISNSKHPTHILPIIQLGDPVAKFLGLIEGDILKYEMKTPFVSFNDRSVFYRYAAAYQVFDDNNTDNMEKYKNEDNTTIHIEDNNKTIDLSSIMDN